MLTVKVYGQFGREWFAAASVIQHDLHKNLKHSYQMINRKQSVICNLASI